MLPKLNIVTSWTLSRRWAASNLKPVGNKVFFLLIILTIVVSCLASCLLKYFSRHSYISFSWHSLRDYFNDTFKVFSSDTVRDSSGLFQRFLLRFFWNSFRVFKGYSKFFQGFLPCFSHGFLLDFFFMNFFQHCFR